MKDEISSSKYVKLGLQGLALEGRSTAEDFTITCHSKAHLSISNIKNIIIHIKINQRYSYLFRFIFLKSVFLLLPKIFGQ